MGLLWSGRRLEHNHTWQQLLLLFICITCSFGTFSAHLYNAMLENLCPHGMTVQIHFCKGCYVKLFWSTDSSISIFPLREYQAVSCHHRRTAAPDSSLPVACADSASVGTPSSGHTAGLNVEVLTNRPAFIYTSLFYFVNLHFHSTEQTLPKGVICAWYT